MKKPALLIFVLLFTNIATNSQSPCLPEGITFGTQEQIDNFQTNYPGCTEIEGYVFINGFGSDITNLNGLNVITAIGGDMSIGENTLLNSLSGLDNLSFIGGYLTITFNNSLTSLTGLEGLTFIGQSLSILYNNALTNLTGLEGLTTIKGINIQNNNSLINLNGLNNLSSIEVSISIYENNSLTSLSGFDNLISIGYDLDIVNNLSIINMTGLNLLTSIGENLSIKYNNSMTSLSGLENLNSVAGSIVINENNNLNSLAGIDSINAGSITSLSIYENASLSTCEVKSVCDYLANPNGDFFIWDNAPGCNSPEEVEEACLIAVEETDVENQISLFPNPADKTISIVANGGPEIQEVSISNHLGQVVLHGKPDNNLLDVSTLQPGVYFIQIISEKSKIIQKLIIQ